MALLVQGIKSSAMKCNNKEGSAMITVHEGLSLRQKDRLTNGSENEPELIRMRRVVSLPEEETASQGGYSSAEEVNPCFNYFDFCSVFRKGTLTQRFMKISMRKQRFARERKSGKQTAQALLSTLRASPPCTARRLLISPHVVSACLKLVRAQENKALKNCCWCQE